MEFYTGGDPSAILMFLHLLSLFFLVPWHHYVYLSFFKGCLVRFVEIGSSLRLLRGRHVYYSFRDVWFLKRRVRI
jgi:hypothetical protein